MCAPEMHALHYTGDQARIPSKHTIARRRLLPGLDNGNVLACNDSVPAVPLILLGRFEVRVLVGAPGEVVAVQAQQLALPRLLAPAPRLQHTPCYKTAKKMLVQQLLRESRLKV